MCARTDSASNRSNAVCSLIDRLSAAVGAVPGDFGREAALETVIWSLLMDGEVAPEAVERRIQQLEAWYGYQGGSDHALR